MILIVPPCSTTNSRPLPSPACSRPNGELKPEATGVNAGGGRAEGGVEWSPPHPAITKTATNKAASNAPVLTIACAQKKLCSTMIFLLPAVGLRKGRRRVARKAKAG